MRWQMWRALRISLLVLGVAAISATGQQKLQLTLQQAAQLGLVQLTGKGGYLGDKVALDAVNNVAGVTIQITANVGDVLPNKNSNEQALVVTKPLVAVIPPGQSISLGGLWTMCIQKHKSSPSSGARFDVADNLANWGAYPAAAELLSYLQYVDAYGLHESGSAQDRVWAITSGPGFPREILTPNAHSPKTGYVVPLDEDGRPITPGSAVGEDFESCDFSRLPWTTGGQARWFVTSDQAHSGHCSARAGRISHDDWTYLKLETHTSGTISFWYKVSSESCCDGLCFYIDDDVVDCWSGEVDWSYATYTVAPGVHTFAWVYEKDGSVSSGQDSAWIDDISFGAGLGGGCPEPNDDLHKACPIAVPFSGQFAIDYRGDHDFFRFTIDRYVSVEINVVAELIGSYLDSVVCLRDQYGHTVACDDDSGPGTDSFLALYLAPGTYYIEVFAYDDDHTGMYELRVTSRSGH